MRKTVKLRDRALLFLEGEEAGIKNSLCKLFFSLCTSANVFFFKPHLIRLGNQAITSKEGLIHDTLIGEAEALGGVTKRHVLWHCILWWGEFCISTRQVLCTICTIKYVIVIITILPKQKDKGQDTALQTTTSSSKPDMLWTNLSAKEAFASKGDNENKSLTVINRFLSHIMRHSREGSYKMMADRGVASFFKSCRPGQS